MGRDVFKALQELGVADPKAQLARFLDDNVETRGATGTEGEKIEFLKDLKDTQGLGAASNGQIIVREGGLWKPGLGSQTVILPPPNGPNYNKEVINGYPAQVQGGNLGSGTGPSFELIPPIIDSLGRMGMGSGAPIVRTSQGIATVFDETNMSNGTPIPADYIGKNDSYIAVISGSVVYLYGESARNFVVSGSLTSLVGVRDELYIGSLSNSSSSGSFSLWKYSSDGLVRELLTQSYSGSSSRPTRLPVQVGGETVWVGRYFLNETELASVPTRSGFHLMNTFESIPPYATTGSKAVVEWPDTTVNSSGHRARMHGRDLHILRNDSRLRVHKNVIREGLTSPNSGALTYFKGGTYIGLFKTENDRVVIMAITPNGSQQLWSTGVAVDPSALVNPFVGVSGDYILAQPVFSNHTGVASDDYSKGNVIVKMKLT